MLGLTVATIIISCYSYNQTKKEWDYNNLMKRADYVFTLERKLRDDPEINKAFYTIEYDKKWYNETFHGSNREVFFDRLLSHLTYIVYIKNQGLIDDKDFELFNYDMKSVLENEDIQNYMYNLYHFSKLSNAKYSFAPLLDYGINVALLSA